MCGELTDDFGGAFEATSIDGCRLFCRLAEILPHGVLGLLQHYLPTADVVLLSALTSKAGIGLHNKPPPDVTFFVVATSNPFHSLVTNHSKVDPADQIRTERLGIAHGGHRLLQSTDVRSERHDSA